MMPFTGDNFAMLGNVIKRIVSEFHFECVTAADRRGPGVVVDDIWRDINQSQLIIAEISDDNPNVWYELGLAHAMNKPVILLRRDSDSRPLPFDVRGLRTLFYSPARYDLDPLLRACLSELISRKPQR